MSKTECITVDGIAKVIAYMTAGVIGFWLMILFVGQFIKLLLFILNYGVING